MPSNELIVDAGEDGVITIYVNDDGRLEALFDRPEGRFTTQPNLREVRISNGEVSFITAGEQRNPWSTKNGAYSRRQGR